MDQLSSNQLQNQEELIQKTINDIHSSLYWSIKIIARIHNISNNTLRKCMVGCNTYKNAHKLQQILFNAEEKIFVWWITCFTYIGFFALPSLVMQIIEKIHCKCVHLWNNTNALNQSVWSINYNWLYCFKSKHFEFVGIWMKLFIQFQFNGINYDIV